MINLKSQDSRHTHTPSQQSEDIEAKKGEVWKRKTDKNTQMGKQRERGTGQGQSRDRERKRTSSEKSLKAL